MQEELLVSAERLPEKRVGDRIDDDSCPEIAGLAARGRDLALWIFS
jgi:hypothetical protein